jgi:glucose-6-phosphate 1-dehydrogenase
LQADTPREHVLGLLEEEGLSKESTTETFAAITLEIDTRRWAGVPFFLRTGNAWPAEHPRSH